MTLVDACGFCRTPFILICCSIQPNICCADGMGGQRTFSSDAMSCGSSTRLANILTCGMGVPAPPQDITPAAIQALIQKMLEDPRELLA